jgi:uncharacterized SAM-binding protein YcdF (DUF218 family)
MKKYWDKKWVRRTTYWLLFFVILFLFRNPILRGFGNYLVAEDELQETEMAFVLGGNSFERGLAAVEISKKFPNQKFTTTGGNQPMQITALDTTMFEAELTKHFMVKKGVSADNIIAMSKGTSTFEEAQEALTYCKNNNIHKISVISSSYHLRRVRWVFQELFEENGITILFHSAPSEDFDPNNWWKSEEGLVTTNNEYIKLVYYFFKH